MEVVKELLENSAYIEHRDMVRKSNSKVCIKSNMCPLFWTIITFGKGKKIFFNYQNSVRWLCVMQGGWTALTWASYKGRVEVATVLLEAGANPNTTGQVKLAYGISTYKSY